MSESRVNALLASVGFQLVPLAHPVGAWPLLAVSPRGLTLVAVVDERPNLMGGTYQVPAGWPARTVRLILVWPDTEPLPKAITLGTQARLLHRPARPPQQRCNAGTRPSRLLGALPARWPADPEARPRQKACSSRCRWALW